MNRAAVLILAVLLLAGCARLTPEQEARKALYQQAAEECQKQFPEIKSISGVGPRGGIAEISLWTPPSDEEKKALKERFLNCYVDRHLVLLREAASKAPRRSLTEQLAAEYELPESRIEETLKRSVSGSQLSAKCKDQVLDPASWEDAKQFWLEAYRSPFARQFWESYSKLKGSTSEPEIKAKEAVKLLKDFGAPNSGEEMERLYALVFRFHKRFPACQEDYF